MSTLNIRNAQVMFKTGKKDNQSFTNFIYDEIIHKGIEFQFPLEEKWLGSVKRYEGYNKYKYSVDVNEEEKSFYVSVIT